MDYNKMANKTMKEIGGDLKKLMKGQLDSNRPIIKVADNFFGAPQVAYRTFSEGGNIAKAAKDTFTKDGKLQYGKIAGSFVGASAAARIASGGGIYKDNRGQDNFIGIPFV